MAASAEHALTWRELNRALLARQLLLEPAPRTLPDALQYAPSMYIGLWSRVEGFERDHLTRALERRTVVQGTLLRATIQLVSTRDYWPLAAALEGARREWSLQVTHSGLSAEEVAAAAARPQGDR